MGKSGSTTFPPGLARFRGAPPRPVRSHKAAGLAARSSSLRDDELTTAAARRHLGSAAASAFAATSTWASTLTAVVAVDVAVDVEAIVDLDVNLRARSLRPGDRDAPPRSRRRGRFGARIARRGAWSLRSVARGTLAGRFACAHTHRRH